jgi:hypothetical protein
MVEFHFFGIIPAGNSSICVEPNLVVVHSFRTASATPSGLLRSPMPQYGNCWHDNDGHQPAPSGKNSAKTAPASDPNSRFGRFLRRNPLRHNAFK